MITLKELLKSKNFNSLPKEHQDNLMTLIERLSRVRVSWGKAMLVTSGYRSMEEHLAIYNRKGITDPNRIPMKSRHLIGAAVDISDPKRELQVWCQNNVSLLEEVGLWMEDFRYTPNWVHFQIIPPASGKRFFIP